MSLKMRLCFAAACCLLLSNCGLIGTALRLAPLALLFVDDSGKAGAQQARGKEVQARGVHAPRLESEVPSGLAFRHP